MRLTMGPPTLGGPFTEAAAALAIEVIAGVIGSGNFAAFDGDVTTVEFRFGVAVMRTLPEDDDVGVASGKPPAGPYLRGRPRPRPVGLPILPFFCAS